MQVLHASEGKWLTNGGTYGRDIYLPDDADASVWHEVTDDEKNAAIAQQEAVSKEEFLKKLSVRFGGGTG